MKFLKPIALIIFVFLITVSCSENETTTVEPPVNKGEQEEPAEPVSVIYFTLTVDASTNTKETEDWIIIHNDTGEILDFKSYEAGDVLTFESLETEVTNKITVSHLRRILNLTEDGYFIQTYTDIDNGSNWKFTEGTAINLTPSIGTFDINITNIPSRSTKIPHAVSSLEHIPYQFVYAGSLINSSYVDFRINNIDLRTETDIIVSIMDDNFDMKYRFVNDVKVGDAYNFDYSEFMAFDSSLIIDLPATTKTLVYDVFTINENTLRKGYHLNSYGYWSYGIPDKIKLGYLNKFNNYLSDIILTFDKTQYRYISIGPKPESLIIREDLFFTPENSSIFEFTFTTNVDTIIRKNNSWYTSTGKHNIDFAYLRWSITSPGHDYPVIGEIPDELKKMYPAMKINDLKYDYSTIQIKSIPYQEWITKWYVDYDSSFTKTEREEYVFLE
ncbi:hypothetical protein [Zobellia barbeyronii]|uniref:DUF4842 domain-containing protein n=1 Tax=Zobellia barbeyronii TaxID=2748009 RepID=A0ABS5WH23_9FLAO|nr:hypothetical protein [Zobellia barbeyronii]MBT2162268.1 hypothetical protein [Zobellia barbeyronii]